MGVFYETMPESLQKWILEQNLIYIASAPLSGSGHVNVSPKGGQYFGIVDERTFWYMDLTGSGSETLSHLHEPGNGRITVMLNAFHGPPKIVRLWGKGKVLEFGTKDFETFVGKHNVQTIPGTRAIVIVDIHQVGSSCGFSVPIYEFKEFRPTLNNFFEKMFRDEQAGKGKGIDNYWAYKNAVSMDGLPAMKRGVVVAQRDKVAPMEKMIGPFAPKSPRSAEKTPATSPLVVATISFFVGMVAAVLLMEYLHIRGSFGPYNDELLALYKEVRGI